MICAGRSCPNTATTRVHIHNRSQHRTLDLCDDCATEERRQSIAEMFSVTIETEKL